MLFFSSSVWGAGQREEASELGAVGGSFSIENREGGGPYSRRGGNARERGREVGGEGAGGSLNGGLANGGLSLKVLVHNCPRLPTIVVVL